MLDFEVKLTKADESLAEIEIQAYGVQFCGEHCLVLKSNTHSTAWSGTKMHCPHTDTLLLTHSLSSLTERSLSDTDCWEAQTARLR